MPRKPAEVMVVVPVAPKYEVLKTASRDDVAAASDPLTVRKSKSGEPAVVASVPQLKTPDAFAFTSQDAAFRFETMSADVLAVPVTVKFVVVAPAWSTENTVDEELATISKMRPEVVPQMVVEA